MCFLNSRHELAEARDGVLASLLPGCSYPAAYTIHS